MKQKDLAIINQLYSSNAFTGYQERRLKMCSSLYCGAWVVAYAVSNIRIRVKIMKYDNDYCISSSSISCGGVMGYCASPSKADMFG